MIVTVTTFHLKHPATLGEMTKGLSGDSTEVPRHARLTSEELLDERGWAARGRHL